MVTAGRRGEFYPFHWGRTMEEKPFWMAPRQARTAMLS